MKKLHPHITNLKQKLFSTKQRVTISILAFLFVVVGLSFTYDYFAKGATYGWLQSSWSGNADTLSAANHTNNQNNWNKFFSKNDNIVANDEITLNSTNLTKTDTTTENFQTGTNTNGTYPILNTNNELKLNIPTCNTTTSNAGPDQIDSATCGLTTVTLNGNAPTVGTGSWTKVSGTGGSFANANLRNTTFTGTAGITYVLRWTISNGTCPASADDVTITFNQNPTVANAGCDQYLYGATATSVTGNSSAIGTGVWTVTSGTATITSPTSPTSGIAGLSANGSAILRWTISNSPCATSFDEVAITTTTGIWSCGLPLTISHTTTNGVAPVNKTISYGTVLSSLSGTSKCWITQNLGGCQATSATDATEIAAGWYWQFNRKQGYNHDGTTRTPATAWISSISENSNWLPANDPCTLELGTGWRIVNYAEWGEEYGASAGGRWNSIAEAYASVLKIHASGVLNGGALQYRGVWFMSRTNLQGSTTQAYGVAGNASMFYMGAGSKAYGQSVRCIKD